MIKLFSYENEVPVTINFVGWTDYLSALPDEVRGSNTNSINYYTVDGAGINLSAPLKFYEIGDFRGYTPTEPSDEEGQISGLLIFNFSTVPHATNIPLSLIFAEDSCVLASVEMLDGDGRRIAFYDNMPIENGVLSCVIQDAAVAQVSIRFIKTGVPHQRVKINSIWFGQVQCYSKFKDNSLLEEINILSTDLPGNSFSASIVYNENIGLSNDKPVYLFNDGIFYGKYYVGDVRRTQENIYSITCYSNIERLDNYNFDNYWANWYTRGGTTAQVRRLNDLFFYINYYTSIEINNEIALPLEQLFDITHEFIEDGKTFRYWLCAAANTLSGWVKSARDDKLSIKNIPTTVTSTIGSDRIIGQAILEKQPIITKCNWNHIIPRFYRLKEESIGTYDTQEITGEFMEQILEWEGEAVITSYERITGHKVQVKSSRKGNYGWQYSTPYVPPIIEITNTKALDAVENILEIPAEPKMCLYRITRPEGTYYLFKYYQEELRKEQIKKFIESRGTVRAKIIAKDEQVGDLVTIQTAWDGEVTGIITKMNTHFSNYGTTAEIEVYEWDV